MDIRPPSPLFFVRHGQTDWNVQLRFQGQTDVALNETGREQARRYGWRLRSLLALRKESPVGLTVVSSPLGRTCETARLICSELGISPEIRTDGRLLEQGYGDWEGRTIAEIQKRYPDEWSLRSVDPLGFRPTGGESGTEVLARIAAAVAEYPPHTLLVGHFGSLLALLRILIQGGAELDGMNPAALTVRQDVVHVWSRGILSAVSVEEKADIRPD